MARAEGGEGAEKAVRERIPDLLATTLFRDPVTGASRTRASAEAFAARVGEKAKPGRLVEKIEKKRRDLAAARSRPRRPARWRRYDDGTAAADVLGGLFGKRKTLRVGKVGSVLSKRRMEGAAETKVETLKAELEELEAKVAPPDPARFESVSVMPLKSHVDVLSIGVAWVS